MKNILDVLLPRLGGGLAFVMVAATACADDATLLAAAGEASFLAELPIVLSVSRLAQPLAEAPGAVTVIDRELIRRSGARTLAEVLRLVPGFQVAANEYGAPVATYHGPVEEFPQGLQVLIDGRSQYSPVTLGGVNWSALPLILDDIERIEVTRGSNSASYGSNAVLGIVNVITRDPALDRGVAIAGRSGEGGIADEYARVGGSIGPLQYRLSYAAQADEGLPRSFDTLRQEHLHFRGDLRLGADELVLRGGRLHGNLAIDGTDPIIDPARYPRPLDQDYAQIDWRRTFDADADLHLRYYRSKEYGGERLVIDVDRYAERELGIPYPLAGIGLATIDNRYQSVRDDFELEHSLRFGEALRLIWGAGYRRDALIYPQFFLTDAAQVQHVRRLFGNAEWRLGERWLANLGGTWEDDDNSETTLSPRATLHFRLTPEQMLRFGVAVAHRTPSLLEQRGQELYRSQAGVPLDWVFYAQQGQQRPERMLSREIGYVADFREQRLQVDLRLSRESIRRGIVRINGAAPLNLLPTLVDDGIETSVNDLDTMVDGLETQLRWQPLPTTRLLFGGALLDVRSRLGPIVRASPRGSEIERQTLAGVPNHSSSLTWMQDLPGGFELTATYRTVGKMQWTNGAGFRVDRYSTLDWRVARPFRSEALKGELALGVRDDGSQHEEFRRGEIVQPRGYVSLRIEH